MSEPIGDGSPRRERLGAFGARMAMERLAELRAKLGPIIDTREFRNRLADEAEKQAANIYLANGMCPMLADFVASRPGPLDVAKPSPDNPAGQPARSDLANELPIGPRAVEASSFGIEQAAQTDVTMQDALRQIVGGPASAKRQAVDYLDDETLARLARLKFT